MSFEITGPTRCTENGICNLCEQPSAFTRGKRIKDSAKAWTLGVSWLRVRVCRECMAILGSALIDASKAGSGDKPLG